MNRCDTYLREEEIELKDIAHGGVCVGRGSDGRVVFVRGGIPGELVRVRIVSEKKKFARGFVAGVAEASPHRIDHPWALGAAGETGAADFGHIELGWQRELKGQVIRTQIERVGGVVLAQQIADMCVTPIGIDSAAEAVADTRKAGWHTRTRFDVIKMETGVGMYREHSHELLPLDSMPLAVRELEELELFGTLWDKVLKPGERLHVVAPASGANVIVLPERKLIFSRASLVSGVLNSKDMALSSKDVANMSAPDFAASIKSIHDFLALPAMRLRERASDGRDIFDYDISPNGFWQIHYRAPSALLREVMGAAQVQAGDRVLELFAGAGLFSVPLARAVGDAGALLTLEGSDTAVADAQANLQQYPWADARQAWIGGREIAEALDEVKPRVVVADPPRAGLGVDCARVLANTLYLQHVVLVSCDPAAMARDAGVFAQAGWQVASFTALDIFPHTHHVESVVLMSKAD